MRASVTVLALLLALALAPAAVAAPWSIAVSGDYGDPIGGAPAFYEDGNAWMTAHATAEAIGITVASTWRYADYSLLFRAPAGGTLAPGVYAGGVEISGKGRACGSNRGRFEVKDLVLGSDGEIERLWLNFEQHCGSERPALFGEIRIGVPVTTTPSAIRWPDREVGRRSSTVAVTYVASAPTTIGAAAITGPFAIAENRCAGQELDAGSACEVWVAPDVPTAAGDGAGTLTLTEAGGATHAVSLARHADATLTEVAIKHDQGVGPLGGGLDRSTPDDHSIYAESWPSQVYVKYRRLGEFYTQAVGFAMPDGRPLAPGTYSAAGLTVPTGGNPCEQPSGEFTVHEIAFDAAGAVKTLDVTFEQRCANLTGRLIGAVRLGATDTAAWHPPFEGDPLIDPGPPSPVAPPSATPTPVPAPLVMSPLPSQPAVRVPQVWTTSTSFGRTRVRVQLLATADGTLRGTVTRCAKRAGKACARSFTVARITTPVKAGRDALTLPLRPFGRPGRYTLTLRLTASDGRVSVPAVTTHTLR